MFKAIQRAWKANYPLLNIIKLMTDKPILYKVLVAGNSPQETKFKWSLPTKLADGNWVPGEWHEIKGELGMCHNGLHLTAFPHYWHDQYFNKANEDLLEVWIAEYEGEVTGDMMDNKVCVRKARLVKPAPRDILTMCRVHSEQYRGRY